MISVEERYNIDYDIVLNNWFYYELHRIQYKINLLSTNFVKLVFEVQYDLYADKIRIKILLKMLFSALNFILFKLSNSIYAKYNRITKQLYIFLIKTILYNTSRSLYTTQLQQFLAFANWNRLQSSIYYFENYTLSKYARWFVIVSSLLQYWLRQKYIQLYFIEDLQKVFVEELLKQNSINIIVADFALNIKLNSLLISS